MIVPDLNLVLYAHMKPYAEHEAARAWWEGLMNGSDDVGLASVVVFGFLRLATHRRVYTTPMSADVAATTIEGWLARPHVHLLLPGRRHLELALGLARSLGTAANLTTDIQIAALAIEHQAELHSNDSDFSRFSGLRWTNPLG